jgi:2-dehydropantoate 2-reductase
MLTRIGILGLGGVGGYFGGLLGSLCESDQFEIVFMLAVKRKAIAESGLTIITENDHSLSNIVSDDPLTIGKLDYLICATKHMI